MYEHSEERMRRMRKIFTPNLYIKSYQSLNIERLKQHKIKVLVCDIDNTLVAHDEAYPDENVKAFIKRVKAAGIQVVLVSNNVKERVETFAHELDVKTYPFAKKPLKGTYLKMMRDCGCKPKEIAVLGDQLLTDMLGANRVGFYTILTHPVAQKDLTCTKINRVVENFVFCLLNVQGKLKKGEFDE